MHLGIGDLSQNGNGRRIAHRDSRPQSEPYAAGIGAPQTKIHAMQHPSNRPFPLTFVRLHSNTILTQFLQPLLEWC